MKASLFPQVPVRRKPQIKIPQLISKWVTLNSQDALKHLGKYQEQDEYHQVASCHGKQAYQDLTITKIHVSVHFSSRHNQMSPNFSAAKMHAHSDSVFKEIDHLLAKTPVLSYLCTLQWKSSAI